MDFHPDKKAHAECSSGNPAEPPPGAPRQALWVAGVLSTPTAPPHPCGARWALSSVLTERAGLQDGDSATLRLRPTARSSSEIAVTGHRGETNHGKPRRRLCAPRDDHRGLGHAMGAGLEGSEHE